jgi:hypothetical protein
MDPKPACLIAGHVRLPGMRERAAIVGGRVDACRQIGRGTEIDLCIPAATAYDASTRSSWSGVLKRRIIRRHEA